jgi:NADH-quinone oxidoreductase subunit J
MPDLAATPNTLALGELIYTRYAFFFEAAALILLVAMIGAIVLTLRHRAYVKRQDISVQVARTRDTAIEIVKVEPGKGL